MPKNKKVFDVWLHRFKVYGLNALLGFGLGVALVLFTITVGKIGAGVDFRGIAQSEVAGPNGSPAISKEGPEKNVSNLQEDREKTNEKESGENSSLPSKSIDQAISERFTVLLVGMDNRPEEKFTSNTDSLIVASLDQKNMKMLFLSIPRDTQVMLAGQKEKINALARLGQGIPSTQQYIADLIGHPINGYIVTNFQGFKDIIDSLGGITINVEKNMYYDTGDSQDRYINLKKGVQRLNGSQALQYARFRNDELADISRTQRQQEVMKAIVAEATAPRNLPKIPFLIPKVYQSMKTDLNVSQLWALAMALKNSDKYEVVNQTLPGRFSVEEGVSYWKVNSKESKQILSRLFQGKKSPVFESTYAKQETVKKPAEPKAEAANAGDINATDTPANDPSGNEGITFEVIGP